jgi:hypothetical protein
MEKKCCEINVRENQRGNQEWTIKRHWQDWAHKTQDEDKQICSEFRVVMSATISA